MKSKWTAILLCAIFVGGCSNQELVEKKESITDETIFTAGLEQRLSRTYIEDGKYLRWNTGDRISLFRGNTLNRQYQFDGVTGDNGGTFSMVDAPFGTGNDLDRHYAVYPYEAKAKISEAGVITTTIPTIQSFAENSFGLGANTMVAVTNDLEDTFLGFKNVGGYLKLQFYGEDVTVKSIQLKGNNNEKISGKVFVTPVYGQYPYTAMADDASDTIVLNCGETGIQLGETEEQATSFWIVLAPTVFETGFSVILTSAKDDEITVSTSNRIVIERNIVKPMAVVELEDFAKHNGNVGVMKEEVPMTDDDTVYVIGGGKIETQKNE